MKRIIALLVALVACFSLLCLPASANELGLDETDRNLLRALIEKFGADPLGWIRWRRPSTRT